MKNLSRVQKTSRVLKWACTLAIPLIPLGLALLWATVDWWLFGGGKGVGIRLWENGDIPVPQPVPVSSQILGYLSSMLPGGLLVYALWQLRVLFGLYGDGRIFTAENTRRLRRFAQAILGLTLIGPLANTLIILALTFGNPPGHRMLSIGVSSSQAITLFLGAMFLVIAWIMDEGREMAEEQAQIV